MQTRQSRSRRSSQRISGPGELVQAVPYLLGFHPHSSLVLIGLDAGQLVVTARLDLADAESSALAHTLSAMARGGVTSVVAVIYSGGDPPGALDPAPWLDLFIALELQCERADCEMLDVLVVAGGRWRSIECASPECCPPEGRRLPDAPSPFTAAATYDGVVALPDRAALEALLDPLPDAAREALASGIEAAEHAALQQAVEGHAQRHQRSVKRALFAAARGCDQPEWAGVTDAEAARFGVALSGAAVRDALWLAVDDGRLDGRPLWRELARRLPAPYDAAPSFLYGWAAWRSGDGAQAGIAAERALRSDPGYSAADLLLAAVANAVDPRTMPRLRLPRSA
jgi:hypothetical protein